MERLRRPAPARAVLGSTHLPAIFTRHDMFAGGRSEYAMTGPEGDVSRGYWEYLSVEPLKSFEVVDGFASADGSANDQMPSMRMVFSFSSTDNGSQVSTTTYFNSVEELEQLIEMGMEEGMRQPWARWMRCSRTWRLSRPTLPRPRRFSATPMSG